MNGLGNKEIFSKNLKYYIERAGKDRSQVCEDLGFKYSTFTDWINGNKYPRIDKIEMLANYFGIQKSALIEERSTAKVPCYYLDPEVAELADQLHKNPELRILFDASKKLTKEDIQFVRDLVDRMKKDDGQ